MEKTWQCKWICNPKYKDLTPQNMLHKEYAFFAAPPHADDMENNHTLFRKAVTLGADFKSVRLDISADDYYKLYVNGRYVAEGPADAYPFCYNYNELDITDYVRPGKNVLCVHVYYHGLICRSFGSGDWRQGMIAELFVDDRQSIDSVWKYREAKAYKTSGFIGYSTQFAENTDERLRIKGWKEADYDDSAWEEAPVKENDDHVLLRQITPCVQTETVYPASVRKLADGVLLDFGTEITGLLSFKAVGKAGQKVYIFAGEELRSETEVMSQMRCSTRYEESWTLDDGENILSQFTYKCFRYVRLLVLDDIALSDFSAEYRHYPYDENACRFASSSPLLNDIWRICARAVENCAQDTFVDCPQREKGGYFGDMVVSAHAHMYLTGDTRLYKKALCDFARTSAACPGLMGVAPGSFMQEFADYSLLFPLLLRRYYTFSGDREFLREMLPTVEGVVAYFDRYRRADGLIENVKDKANLVDWPANLRDGYDFELTIPNGLQDGCHNVINAQYYSLLYETEKIREILSIPHENRAEKVKQAYMRAFYRAETGLFADSDKSMHSSLHANAIALFFGIVPENTAPIVKLVRQKGLACGVLCAYYLLHGLARIGEYDLCFELLTNEGGHSWANMLREGATATFEAWGKADKWNTSLCHAFAAAPVSVLIECICGIRPKAPGFAEIEVCPHVPENVDILLSFTMGGKKHTFVHKGGKHT